MKSIYKPVAPYNAYTANGSTISFTYNFLLLWPEDLSVYIDQELQTTGYTVTGVYAETGGTVTFLTPPAKGKKVYLVRLVQLYRVIEYQDNGDLLADTVNKDFDRIWQVLTQGYWALQFCMRRSPWGGPWEGQGYRVSDIADPIDDQDAVTKKYAEAHYGTNNWRGAWNANTDYFTHDGVHYNGSSWYCWQNNRGVPPGTNGTYWDMMAQRGDDGDNKYDSQGTFKAAIKLNGSLDGYKTPGLYYNNDTGQATSANKYPENGIEGEMEVYFIDPTTPDVVQKFTTSTNHYYGRVYYGGAWSAWMRFADNASFSNYYTKTEIDAKFKNYYTKTEVDNLIANSSGGGDSGGGSGVPGFGDVGCYAMLSAISSLLSGYYSNQGILDYPRYAGQIIDGEAVYYSSFSFYNGSSGEDALKRGETASGKWMLLSDIGNRSQAIYYPGILVFLAVRIS